MNGKPLKLEILYHFTQKPVLKPSVMEKRNRQTPRWGELRWSGAADGESPEDDT